MFIFVWGGGRILERDRVSTLRYMNIHKHTHRCYLLGNPFSAQTWKEPLRDRCSAFVILVVFCVALAGGATIHWKWVGMPFRRTVEGLEVTGLVTLVYDKPRRRAGALGNVGV